MPLYLAHPLTLLPHFQLACSRSSSRVVALSNPPQYRQLQGSKEKQALGYPQGTSTQWGITQELER